MKLFPAIDMKDGKCVRLSQGRFDQVKVYAEDPLTAALAFVEAGARYIHTVDLDGALQGRGMNTEALRRLVEQVPVPVQNGGGIRTMQQVREKLALGLDRVIIGTAAVKDPDFLKEALETFGPEKIVVGIDASRGLVATHGWQQVSTVPAVELGQAMFEMGLKYTVYTDISRDGMLTGPNIEETMRMQRETGLTVIASGGVSGMEDLKNLQDAGAYGVIIGKAIYEGRIDVAKAVKLFETEEVK